MFHSWSSMIIECLFNKSSHYHNGSHYHSLSPHSYHPWWISWMEMICSDPQDPEDRGVGSDDLEGHGICRCCDAGHGMWSLGPRVKQQGAPGASERGIASDGSCIWFEGFASRSCAKLQSPHITFVVSSRCGVRPGWLLQIWSNIYHHRWNLATWVNRSSNLFLRLLQELGPGSAVDESPRMRRLGPGSCCICVSQCEVTRIYPVHPNTGCAALPVRSCNQYLLSEFAAVQLEVSFYEACSWIYYALNKWPRNWLMNGD